MTATLSDVNSSDSSKRKSKPSAEEAAAELVRAAREQGLSLTGPDGLLKQFTKDVCFLVCDGLRRTCRS